MACSMANKYDGWCKGLDSYEVDGKRYCIFHAPKGKKNVSTLEEFNELIYAQIGHAKHKNTPCNLSGTVFEGDISFNQFGKDNPLPEINFSGAQFSGEADFSKAQFGGRAYFYKAQFGGRADFRGARFSGLADFSLARFSGEAVFFEAQFGGEAVFLGAQFSGKAVFSVAQFSWGGRFL